MFTVYILKSSVNGRLCVGVTQDFKRRFKEHNQKKVRSTKAYTLYTIVKTEEFPTKYEAQKRERQIKRSGVLRRRFKSMAPSSSG